MAPNKKKKKPTSNSARGFATTSVPSKHRSQDGERVRKATPDTFETKVEANQPVQNSYSIKVQKESEKALDELDSEELEKQLEISELRILIDRYGESTKKNATRQASRLQTERRLLRTQADQMRIHRWLPAELVQSIIDRLAGQEAGNDKTQGEYAIYSSLPKVSEDDLLIKIWTLYRLLPLIGFSDSHRETLICELLKNYSIGTTRTDFEGKESLWGLDYCLNWFAEHLEPQDTLSYNVTRFKPLKQPFETNLGNGNTSLSTPDDSRPATPSSEPTTESRNAISDVDTTNSSLEVASESESELESDLEPDELVGKYVALETLRIQICPQDAEHKTKNGKRQSPHGLMRAPVVRKVARLDSKIARIKSDPLFDQDEADRQWTTIKIELLREAANRRRLGIHEEVKRPKPNESSSATDEDEEDGTMLGELFLSLPESTSNGDGSTVITNSVGTSIKVRDFGKWTGMSPRRILEETCRARDPSSKVLFKTLSETIFSNRHCVQVQWSRAQELGFTIPIEGVVCEINSRWVIVKMETVSCPDALQSEAYASTIALFIIFASSAKEEKAHLRLPPVWRDVWEDFSLLRKLQSDNKEIQALQELRAMVAEQSSLEGIGEHAPTTAVIQCARDARTAPESAVNNNRTPSLVDAAALVLAWTTRSSTAPYQNMLVSRKTLPIWSHKQELLQAFNSNQIVIVCGETGCGKSTQVPAYILEQELSNGRSCKVYCTEPRRISAISLARRVSEELGERKGEVGTSRSLVGFAVRLDSQITNQTRLVYATTGIVMRMLESVHGLEDVTHLVLDEVHERSIESDFLLIVIRKLIIKRPTLKVILMSATVDAGRFSTYLGGAPVLTVPGRTFPVEIRFLEDAIEATGFQDGGGSAGTVIEEDEQDDDFATNDKTANDSSIKAYCAATRETLAKFDEYRVNYDLITRLLEVIATSPDYVEYSKAILVFLPGIAEIRRLNDMLVSNQIFAESWNIFPLHSTIATEEQERAFLIPPPGVRKLVIATNIAETGITIPDVTCVIDAGKHKEMRFDERRQLSRLVESFISRANAKQRRGRAGRVQKGLCFHLFSKHRHDTLLAEQQTPEMLRLSLQDLVLRVKICKLGGVEETLAEALDPPSAKNVRRAVDALVDVKALTATEDLTPLGRQLSRLPLDVFLGKLILLGTVFGCLDGTLAIAAILSSKSPFLTPLGARGQADLARIAFKKSDSDLLTVYNAYSTWRRICSAKQGMTEQQFCRKNFLNAQTLSNIEELKGQLLSALVDAKFATLTRAEKQTLDRVRSYSRHRNFVPILDQYNNNANNDLILNSVIACSFYPKLLKRDGKGWRNIANNQSVSLHPTSVNKGVDHPPQWLSFYHIMQSSNKFYNAHETSAVEDFAIALMCGDAEFKMYSGVIVIDGNRVRFAVDDWKQMLAIKTLRTQLREITTQAFKNPGRQLSHSQKGWLDIWQKIFTVEQKRT